MKRHRKIFAFLEAILGIEKILLASDKQEITRKVICFTLTNTFTHHNHPLMTLANGTALEEPQHVCILDLQHLESRAGVSMSS